MLASIDANILLLEIILAPLLAKDRNTLTDDGEALRKSVENTIYLTGLFAVGRIDDLEEHAATMTPEQLAGFSSIQQSFDTVIDAWHELKEAVHSCSTFGKPTD